MYLRHEFNLTAEHKQLLRRQKIDARQPGVILVDFQHLLDFVGADGVPLTDGGLLRLKLLGPLNEQLARSVQLGLNRPQQKSFPHINGLYLLLRATGLGQIDATPKTPRLRLDPEVLDLWTALNPAEQYLTLLETWLLRGRSELIGEERGAFWSDLPLGNWASFFHEIPDDGLVINADHAQTTSLRYWPGLHNLALLELFGLVRIEDGPPIDGAGWQIERIWRTPLGDAWLPCLLELFSEQIDDLLADGDTSEIPFGIWQPALQVYFPEWQRTLTFSEPTFQEGVFVFKVSLWRGRVWRRLAIPADFYLDQLAGGILNAVNFDFDHLYRFTYTNRFGARKFALHPYMSDYGEGTIASEVQIGDPHPSFDGDYYA